MTNKVVNSIVVGDVGSGKTAVAFSVGVAYLLGLESGTVAMMAPTEILAVQHYRSLLGYLERCGDTNISTICITSTTKEVDGLPVKKKELDAALANSSGRVFVIGTHALLHRELHVDLMLVDEQHRFGVVQRGSFVEAGSTIQPHYISFTATPIPRTLALTVYRHLDMQRLERLEGRAKIETRVVALAQKGSILERIKHHTSNQGKVYIIVPQIDAEEADEVMTVKKTENWLLPEYSSEQMVVTHGKEKEKTIKLTAFKTDPNIKICIATSVIEVGVDVGEATLIVILNAERFGLAALHQLRGRVGRNNRTDNECILATAYPSPKLNHVANTHDGFAIAEYDLEVRGGGTMVGMAQSGFDDTTSLIMSLEPEQYDALTRAVDEIEFDNPKFSRLRNYVQSTIEKTWKE